MKIFKRLALLALIALPLSASAQDVDYSSPKTYVIGGVKVTGVKYLSEEQILSVTGLNKGDKIVIPSIELSDILKRVWAQRYFSDAGFFIDSLSQNKDTVWLGLHLSERPRVSRWAFSGIRSGQKSDLNERLKLKRGSELSDYIIESSTNIIKKYFHEKGFLKCQVKVLQEEDPVIQNAVRVTFDIDRGPRVKIGRITFTGNENLTERKLVKSMKHTRDMRLMNFFKSKKFKQKEYAEDKNNLISAFNEQGFRDARILKDTIYYISDDRLGIDFTLEEGDRYYFRDITWTGNSIYSADQLNSVLRIKKGDIYDLVTMDKRLNGDPKQMEPDVKKMYTDNGYLFFSFTMLQLEPELSEKRWFRLVSQAPMGIIGACMLANFFNNMVFTITPDEHIIFNRWYPVLPVMIVLYLLVILGVSLLRSWQSRLPSQRKQYMTLAVSVLFIFLCVAIDDRLKNTTILPMAIFAAIFFVFINMQESNIYSDALTHMNNRRKADEYMASQLDRVSEADPLLLYMLDVNDFKHINDAFGHAEGDRALMLVATAVKMAAARYKGFAARYGGDEFILAVHPALLGKGFDPEAPIRDMQAHSEETCRAEGRRYTVTISAGWARCTRPRMLLTDCVKQADEMLYERKAEYHRRRDGA